MMQRIHSIFSIGFLFLATIAFAQRNCASHSHLEDMIQQNPEMRLNMEQIERHTHEFINSNNGSQRAVVTIPVVFHIVWRTGKTVENISDAQIQSQLDVINRDFRKLNTDVSNTPSLFSGLAADCEIQFCMAQRDPNGNSSTGIVRYQSTRTTDFGTSDAVKSTSTGGAAAWNSSKYLNIWVCSIGGGILGYAQFPGGAASTDGVVIDYRYFGTTGTATSPFNLGRTATHEIGHWLNLRHIWGDANCGSDLVSDTPTHTTSNGGCPTFPKTNTCGGVSNTEMTMNYMDYTDDACMYMFSAGQKARMQALFATGGARVSLLTSDGCQPGTTPTCAVPTGLSSSSVTSSGATVSWTAASGATSYNLQYKTSTATTWTTVTGITTTSRALTGLAASTTYNFQVATVCSSGTTAYSTAGSFTTSAVTTTCAVPTGLTSSSVTSSGATVAWTAASGATSYNLQYKTSSATTWTTVTGITTTSRALTGLTASTTYNYQVATVCSNGTSAYSTAGSFTTSAVSTGCQDNYEPNNSQSAAVTIALNTTINALINSTSDQDWFKITTTSAAPKVKVTLSSLPADYDLYLYNSAGSLLASSLKNNKTTEIVKYNSATVGATYYVRVYSSLAKFNTTTCYALLPQSSATNFREISDDNEEIIVADTPQMDFSVAPNPASDEVILSFLTKNDKRTDVTILDLTGKVVYHKSIDSSISMDKISIDISNFVNGMYIINVQNDISSKANKLLIQR